MAGVQNNSAPYPDLNTWHQCRNTDVVYDWVMERQERNGIDPVIGVQKRPGLGELAHDP